MSSYVRLKWLHEQLHNKKYPTIKNLVESFEISYRQGQRDIEYMRDSLGAPIEYSVKHKGYFYADEFSMPVVYLSLEEQEYINKLSDYYSSLSDMGIDEFKRYAGIYKRISSDNSISKNSISILQVPYIAKIKYSSERYSYRLLDKFFRGKNIDHICIYEFYNVELFIGLLMTCGSDFKIIFPNWLKERILQTANKTIENNKYF